MTRVHRSTKRTKGQKEQNHGLKEVILWLSGRRRKKGGGGERGERGEKNKIRLTREQRADNDGSFREIRICY